MGQLLLLVNISILLYTLVFQTYFYIILSLDKLSKKTTMVLRTTYILSKICKSLAQELWQQQTLYIP